MTQDEVDLIYDYLHENYRYEDGCLILLNNKNNRKKGDKAGTFFNGNRGNPVLKISLTINKIYYNLYLATAIYLYHHKLYFPYISFLDSNCMNLKIDNLLPSSNEEKKKEWSSKCKGIKPNKSSNKPYKCIITRKNKEIYLGCYATEIEAHEVYIYASETLARNSYILINELKLLIKEKFPNSSLRIVNKCPTGVKDRGSKFEAYIYKKLGKKKYKQIVLGYYKSPQEAHEAYLKAKKELENK